jgi:hypothetical protein
MNALVLRIRTFLFGSGSGSGSVTLFFSVSKWCKYTFKYTYCTILVKFSAKISFIGYFWAKSSWCKGLSQNLCRSASRQKFVHILNIVNSGRILKNENAILRCTETHLFASSHGALSFMERDNYLFIYFFFLFHLQPLNIYTRPNYDYKKKK